MLEFLKRLFRKEEAPPAGSIAQELWVADLSQARRGRFLEASAEGYRSRYAEDALILELSRPDLFAWTEAQLYRYSDFVVEGELEFRPRGELSAKPYSACGFLFRYQDESNFYSVLVSDKGFFRLDVIFNGNPRPLVAWTELPPWTRAERSMGGRAAPRQPRRARRSRSDSSRAAATSRSS